MRELSDDDPRAVAALEKCKALDRQIDAIKAKVNA